MSHIDTFLRTSTPVRVGRVRRITMSKRKTIHRRRWLKPGDSEAMSYVAYTINSYDTSVKIADCYKQVSIGVYNKRDLRKIDVLIEELTKFRELAEKEINNER